jgi:hypothetical protein
VSCDSCPTPLVLSSEDARLLEDVAKYGKAQRVEVSGVPVEAGICISFFARGESHRVSRDDDIDVWLIESRPKI